LERNIFCFFIIEADPELSKRLKEDRRYLSKGSNGADRRTRSRKFIICKTKLNRKYKRVKHSFCFDLNSALMIFMVSFFID